MADLKRSLRVACSPGEARIAVVEDGVLRDFALWRPGRPDGVGDVYRGRVAKIVPALGGSFIALGGGTDGFLPSHDGAPPLVEGESVLVSVVRAPMGGKGPRLKIAGGAPTSGETGLLTRGPSPLERLAGSWDGQIVIDHSSFAARVPAALRTRVQRVPQAFDEGVEDAVQALGVPEVALPGGMSATITPTPALVAIDMDSGAASATASAKQTAQFAANRDALPVLLDQIRLRNLSGAILIDPAGLNQRKRQALREPVEAALRADPLRPRCLGVTGLGLIEIVRARVHPPLHELLSSAHGQALAALHSAVVRYAGRPDARPALRAGSGVFAALEGDLEAMSDLRGWLAAPLDLRLDPSLPPLSWSFSDE
ncbi:hypothetical protein AA23498_2450 [Acetobacter nitrogenifigens DSM 23921 = NBRC 105050]|uniref:S1 motif domain-containing protein n=1 Tax=Acetobacter nitrogenifigens DSM 23921 = NBRC 105050 TaxID=1120919 RepID=A0A511X7M5_9PROT|nr:ribonuclease E/G [Acetobacter nitrogenifigens]GBQ95830.1 hypothetical protein AA23498_2450 [Acetobacter nitrogenifigens DSM 23921 = NBRC 105050]GEN58956.1 hypothetical protein ANI02nite_08400 [Acetobacter nitrogenifigens DSM 23921 = NBRC 105050]